MSNNHNEENSKVLRQEDLECIAAFDVDSQDDEGSTWLHKLCAEEEINLGMLELSLLTLSPTKSCN